MTLNQYIIGLYTGERFSPTGALRTMLRATAAALSLAVPISAHAAEEPWQTEPTAAEEDAGSPIIVTASRRREEAVQDVPIAISVIDAATLDRRGDFTLGQIQQQVPALQVFSFNPRNTNINIRGLGSNVALTNDGLENGVGFYIDNVYYGRVGLSQFDLVDLEQIEVLRGPQGTLFGKNTTSGVINISTRKPSFEPDASGEVSIGNYGYRQVRGSVSGPIVTDRLAVRLSGAYTKRDGLLFNTTTGEEAQDYENASLRGQLLVKPTDDLSVRLIGDYASQKQNYALNVFANYVGTYDNGATIPNNFAARLARFNRSLPAIDPFARRGESDSHYQSNMDGYGVSGQVDWDLGGAALTSITAYRWWDWNPANDGDSTALPVVTKAQQANRQRQFSQEIRLASKDDGPIDYVIGGYYFWQIIRGYGASRYGSAAAAWNLPAVDPVVGNAALDGFEANSTSTPQTRSLALFGQADWSISDALTLTAGLRYTHEKKEGAFRQYWVAGNDLSGLTPAQQATANAIRAQFNPVQTFATAFSDDSLSGLVTLRWQPTRDAIIYGTYSRGNKSGGLNLTALPAGIAPEVAPERVDAYEVGFKSQLFDRALTFNGALYWIDTANYQTAITEQVANTVTYRQYIANIPKVRSRGFELDAVYAPSQHFSLNASLAYADTSYRDYRNAPQAVERLNISAVQDLTGQQLPGVPRFTYTLGADVSTPVPALGSTGEIYGHADWSHRSSFNTSASNSRLAIVDGYGLLNGRIGLRFDDGRYDLSIWGKNLLDENYFQTLSAGNTGLVTGLIGDPRTYGITLRAKL
ncbi:TonB-dependent receptor [Sphingobium sp. B11D3D]|uniref:TonB-dependent receptor n=1 Tax=Sphingobium sp. B11D3D TaxID=2940576 RepID=UPI00222597DE|nr:TonB-dependent receptor [Sphingobium sp. B11D3D]